MNDKEGSDRREYTAEPGRGQLTQQTIDTVIADIVPRFDDMLWDWGNAMGISGRLTSPATKNKIHFIPHLAASRTLELQKEGEDRLVFRNGLIRNTNSLSSSVAWQELFTGMQPTLDLLNGRFEAEPLTIPISPIFRFRQIPDGRAEVWTRYTGISIGYYVDQLIPKLNTTLTGIEERRGVPKFEAAFIRGRVQTLTAVITEQIDRISRQLDDLYYYHGHTGKGDMTHDGNLTLEFITKRYMQEMLNNGYTVNTIPYNADRISFSPHGYLRGEPVFPVVRLIDFSQARFFDRSLENMLASDRIIPSASTLITLLSSDRPYQRALAGYVIYILRDTLDWNDQLISAVKSTFSEDQSGYNGLAKLIDPSTVWTIRKDIYEQLCG